MSFSIAGKTAIVTGAAHGVGLAIANQFVEAGANVVYADMDQERLIDQLGEDPGENVRFFACDLRERLSVANLLSYTLDAFDQVDILINASRQIVVTDPLDVEDDSVVKLMEQNLFAALRLSQAVAKQMISQAEGRDRDTAGAIVNLSSIMARRTTPDLLGYSISCAALDQMTRSLAVALANHRIRVNAVAFGSVMSASLKQALEETPQYRDDIQDGTPLSRIASPREVADAAQFLASDGAGFVTGQIITVDGGRTLLDPVGAPVH